MKLGQLFFTSLPRNESPGKEEGYQVVCWSKSYLSLQEASDIKKYLIYSISDNDNPIKRQYFFTQTGKVVLSETKLTEKSADGSSPDSYKRNRSYFSHCYILESKDFSEIRNNPFIIFSNLKFLSSINELQNIVDIRSQNANLVDFELKETLPPTLIKNLSLQDLFSILGLADNASKLIRDKKQIQFIGDTLQFESLLKLVFSLIPATSRFSCTFDSFYEKCNLPLGSFWAVALKTPIMGGSFISIDLASGKVLSPEWQDMKFNNEYYADWLRIMLQKTNNLPDLISRVPTAEYLSGIMSGNRLYYSNPDKDTVNLFCSIHKEKIKELLYNKLRQFVTPTMLDLAYKAITFENSAHLSQVEWLHPDKMSYATVATEFTNLFISDLSMSPDKQAVANIRKLASAGKNYVLFALCKVWQDDIENLHEFLKTMPIIDYEVFSRLVLKREELYASFLVAEGKVATLLKINFEFEDDDDFVDFIRTVIQIGEGNSLGPLEQKLGLLSKPSLKRIHRIIDKKIVDPSFAIQVLHLLDSR